MSMLIVLLAVLMIYYKINWHIESLNVDQMQNEKYRMFRNNQRYKRLLKSKHVREAVTEMNIIQPDEN